MIKHSRLTLIVFTCCLPAMWTLGQSNNQTPPPAPEFGSENEEFIDGYEMDPDDPMNDMVGMIKIPELGTNEVLEMLENLTGKPILRQQSLPAVKITFFSQEALSRGEAISAIESLLSLNGIAITQLGDLFLKAVPNSVINAQGAPVWEETTLDAEPTQKIYEKMFFLDFLTAQEAVQAIQPLMSQGAPISFTKNDILLISDALVNLQRIEKVLQIIDKPSAMKSEILFFQLKHISAQEASRRLTQIQNGPLKNRLENNTSIDADERTNQLIVFTHPGNKDLITGLVEKLDIDIAPLTATKVHSIRYADATEVVSIIDQVVTGQKKIRDESGNNRQQAAQRQANQAAAAARSDAGNLQFSDFLTIVADERANTIVASGTNNDLLYLERLISEIDTLLAQVRIEVVITEVRLSDSQTRGIDNFGFSYNSSQATGFNIDDGKTSASDTTNIVDQKFAAPGNFYGVTIPGVTWGPEGFGIEFVLNAAKTNSDVTVLSAPTIVTTHNKEATVSVGEERPVITSILESTSSTGENLTSRGQVQFKDIKLELKVTPLIGSDGVVQLEIEQLIQSVIGNIDINDNSQPIVGTRRATSYVSVKDNELIVLGGLQSLDSLENNNRMAILGDLPVFGPLFRSKSVENTRNELLIFIRPTIIRTTTDANQNARDSIDASESQEKVDSFLQRGTFKQPVPERTEERKIPRRFDPR